MKIIRKRLYENEGLSPWVRWDETCECVQSLFGDTWVDNPTADPRYNPANLAPVNSTPDPKCSAAYGMRVKIENIMNAFFLADALIDAANAVLAVITVTIPGVGLIWRVIFLVCEALYAIGTAALVASFTEAAYDQLQCIFYANISEDGQMSEAQLSATNTQICADMDVTICAAMGLILNMLGHVGMSNAGAMFGDDGDCADCCESFCYHFDFTLNDGGFTDAPGYGDCAQWVDGVGWQSVNVGITRLYISRVFSTRMLTRVSFTYVGEIGAGGREVFGYVYDNETLRYAFPNISYSAGSNERFIEFDPPVSANNVQFFVFADNNTVTNLITDCQIEGEACSPFGTDNC